LFANTRLSTRLSTGLTDSARKAWKYWVNDCADRASAAAHRWGLWEATITVNITTVNKLARNFILVMTP